MVFIVCICLFAKPVVAQSSEIQTDILVQKIASLIQSNRHAEALPYFQQLEQSGAKLTEVVYFRYIDALDKSSQINAAVAKGKEYLEKFSNKGKYYSEVIEIISRRSIEQDLEAKKALRFSEAAGGVLLGASTGLQWTQSDNGSEIDWYEASAYCQAKGSGWGLPSQEELAGLFDPTQSQNCVTVTSTCKVSPKFRLTGWYYWSRERGSSSGAWVVDMSDGARGHRHVEARGAYRALCVRRP